MGNFFSFELSCDLVTCLSRCFPCPHLENVEKLKENVGKLELLKVRLKAMRDDVNRDAIHQGKKLRQWNLVTEWVKLVDWKIKEVDELLQKKNTQLSILCCGGYFTWCCVYEFGEDVMRLLGEVNLLIEHNNFDLSATSSFAVVQFEMPILPLELPNWGEIWERLKLKSVNANTPKGDDDTGVILGLYGKKGVGKTIYLMRINNAFLDIFDCVIWVDAMNLDCYKLQDAIASRAGLSNEPGWSDRNFFDRACIIYNSLKSKQFVLLLDNLFTCVDLNQIGIPYPNVANKSRIVFTTTNIEVYHEMDATSKMEIQPLEDEKAWELFKRRIAVVYNDEIGELARKVADLCGGVPRTLITVGRAMAREDSPREWLEHLEVLKKCQLRLRGTEIQPLDPVDESKEYFDAIMQHRNKSDFYSLGASSSNAQNLKLGGTVHGFQNSTGEQQIENSPSGLAKLRAQVEELSLKAQFQESTIQELKEAFAVLKEDTSKCKAQVGNF